MLKEKEEFDKSVIIVVDETPIHSHRSKTWTFTPSPETPDQLQSSYVAKAKFQELVLVSFLCFVLSRRLRITGVERSRKSSQKLGISQPIDHLEEPDQLPRRRS